MHDSHMHWRCTIGRDFDIVIVSEAFGFEMMAENWSKFWICMHPRAAFNESICQEKNMNYICTEYKYMHKKCVLYMYLFVASLSSSA